MPRKFGRDWVEVGDKTVEVASDRCFGCWSTCLRDALEGRLRPVILLLNPNRALNAPGRIWVIWQTAVSSCDVGTFVGWRDTLCDAITLFPTGRKKPRQRRPDTGRARFFLRTGLTMKGHSFRHLRTFQKNETEACWCAIISIRILCRRTRFFNEDNSRFLSGSAELSVTAIAVTSRLLAMSRQTTEPQWRGTRLGQQPLLQCKRIVRMHCHRCSQKQSHFWPGGHQFTHPSARLKGSRILDNSRRYSQHCDHCPC